MIGEEDTPGPTSIAAVATDAGLPASPTEPVAIVLQETDVPTEEPTDSLLLPSSDDDGLPFQIELIVGGVVLTIVLIYLWLYWLGASTLNRYSDGFVVERCPVCKTGNLHVEERNAPILGIPRSKRMVKCDHCRSVLREVGRENWRYAVDRIENPRMYEKLNGRRITDDQIENLVRR